MGLVKAFTGAISGTFSDQWKEIITSGHFDEHTVVTPAIIQSPWGRTETENRVVKNVLSNGSIIYVPENTAAFIFSQSGIEEIVTEPGGYKYQNGQKTVFDGDGIGKAIFSQIGERIGFGGITPDNKQIAFVNLREIRDIKFGTRGAQVYNDSYYGTDLEIFAYGSFTIRITDAKRFITNFVPAGTVAYSFDEKRVREQIISEFLQSFIVALNSMSDTYRISQLPAQANTISQIIQNDTCNAGTWEKRFGFSIVQVAIENVEFTEDSRELVKVFSANKMNLRAYEEVSQRASNIAAQQKIAQGVENNGFGEMGNMFMGVNLSQGVGTYGEPLGFVGASPEPPPIPTSVYHVAVDGNATGPFELSVIKQMVSSGQIAGETMVWKQGMESWERADSVSELKKMFPPAIK